jgi:hypothetical protein
MARHTTGWGYLSQINIHLQDIGFEDAIGGRARPIPVRHMQQ